MSVRSCCYRDCENYSINNVPAGSFTLFQVPRDSTRRKLWMKLGNVNPDIPPKDMYMCSEHFDRSKHMSINQRRTLLLGNAEPFPYVEKELVLEAVTSSPQDAEVDSLHCFEEDDNSYMIFEHEEIEGEKNNQVNKQETEENIQVVSTVDDDDRVLAYDRIKTKRNICDHKDDLNADTDDIANVYKAKDKPLIKKIKILETSANLKLKCSNYPRAKTGNEKQEDSDEKLLLDPKHVSTFIFKGEEYVQMPKDYYFKEKLALSQKVQIYENLLKDIKQQLNVIDFI